MNQIKIGKFIATCRKEKGITQAQLADKLNITDRAVSKWETGKCMPDSSIMLELCSILGVSVNELLSGERIEMDKYEEKLTENLIDLKRKDENNINLNKLISIIFTVIMIVGIGVCCICDLAISRGFTWSLIPLSCILFTWSMAFPIILGGKKGIRIGLIACSVLILPFLYSISLLVKVHEVFSIGSIMAILALIYVWLIYGVFIKLGGRKLLATGIIFMAAIPFTILINYVLYMIIGVLPIDVWDILSMLLLFITAIGFIIGDKRFSCIKRM